MGSTHCDDGMEHAWSPGRSAAGRRLRPSNRTEAPSCLRTALGSRSAGRRWVSRRFWRRPERVRRGGQRLNCWTHPSDSVVAEGCLRTISACHCEGLRWDPVMRHDGLTRSPSGLSERRTGFSPPELGSPTAPVVPPTGAVPCPDGSVGGAAGPGRRPAIGGRRPQVPTRCEASSTGRRAGRRPGSRRRPGGRACRHDHPPRLTAVVGASGGLGASTLALAVGRRLAATGPPAVVVDLDLLRVVVSR